MANRFVGMIGKIIASAFSVIENFFISKIDNKLVRDALSLQMAPLKATALVLTDGNPRNSEQVEEVWKQHLNRDVTRFADGAIDDAIAKIDDPDVRLVLDRLANPVVGLLAVVSDADPDNKAQIKALVNGFLTDPGTHEVAVHHILIPFLTKKIKDEALREMIIAIILDGLLIED